MIGKTVLGYTIKEKIGSGGFGTVYKAEKINPSGCYIRAVKHISLPTQKQYIDVLNSMGGDYAKAEDYFTALLKDIVSEIQILNNLTEQGAPHVVSYFENQIDETKPPLRYDIYILMEYLTSFSDYAAKQPFMVRDVIRLGKDMLCALMVCHKNQIIHRDIKEDNIFVGKDGSFKLGDFGVSKKLNGSSRAESMKGTPNYIAPEVYLGKEQYDKTVDLYSLGIVLYKLLNYNRNPFLPAFPAPYNSADEDQAFEKRMRGETPDAPCLADNALGKVIVKALLPRMDRYGRAEEFYEELCLAEKQMNNEELNTSVLHCAAEQDRTDRSAYRIREHTNGGLGETVGEAVYENREHRRQKTEEERNAALFETVGSQTVLPEHSGREAYADAGMGAVHNRNTEEGKRRHIYEPGNAFQNPVQQPEVPAVQKKSFGWILYGLPFVIAFAYVMIYAVYLPHVYDRTVSAIDWALLHPSDLLEAVSSSEHVFPAIYKLLCWKILNYVFYAGFIASLYALGRKLHKSKPEYAVGAGLKEKEAYELSMQVYGEMKSLSVSKEVLHAVKNVNDRLKNESDFGYGSPKVIQCEKEIESLLNLIASNMEGLYSQTGTDAVERAILSSCKKIMVKLDLRMEQKKK